MSRSKSAAVLRSYQQRPLEELEQLLQACEGLAEERGNSLAGLFFVVPWDAIPSKVVVSTMKSLVAHLNAHESEIVTAKVVAEQEHIASSKVELRIVEALTGALDGARVGDPAPVVERMLKAFREAKAH